MAFYGWTNSKFQTVHFLAGACHTPLEAHRILKQNLMNKEDALASNDGATGFYINQAKDEVAFLQECLARLETHLGFVPTSEDYQQNSQLEWKYEFMTRAENFLMSEGRIPVQELTVMRQHPDFAEIKTHATAIALSIKEGNEPLLLEPPWKKTSPLLENRT